MTQKPQNFAAFQTKYRTLDIYALFAPAESLHLVHEGVPPMGYLMTFQSLTLDFQVLVIV